MEGIYQKRLSLAYKLNNEQKVKIAFCSFHLFPSVQVQIGDLKSENLLTLS